MKLEFTEWDAGHHGHKPEPIDAANVENAFRIFEAVTCALNQGQSIRAMVQDSHGDVVARFEAMDDESPNVDYPEHGDMVCSECGAFWSLCPCADGGFVPMAADALDDRDPEMILKMNAEMGMRLLEVERG